MSRRWSPLVYTPPLTLNVAIQERDGIEDHGGPEGHDQQLEHIVPVPTTQIATSDYSASEVKLLQQTVEQLSDANKTLRDECDEARAERDEARAERDEGLGIISRLQDEQETDALHSWDGAVEATTETMEKEMQEAHGGEDEGHCDLDYLGQVVVRLVVDGQAQVAAQPDGTSTGPTGQHSRANVTEAVAAPPADVVDSPVIGMDIQSEVRRLITGSTNLDGFLERLNGSDSAIHEAYMVLDKANQRMEEKDSVICELQVRVDQLEDTLDSRAQDVEDDRLAFQSWLTLSYYATEVMETTLNTERREHQMTVQLLTRQLHEAETRWQDQRRHCADEKWALLMALEESGYANTIFQSAVVQLDADIYNIAQKISSRRDAGVQTDQGDMSIQKADSDVRTMAVQTDIDDHITSPACGRTSELQDTTLMLEAAIADLETKSSELTSAQKTVSELESQLNIANQQSVELEADLEIAAVALEVERATSASTVELIVLQEAANAELKKELSEGKAKMLELASKVSSLESASVEAGHIATGLVAAKASVSKLEAELASSRESVTALQVESASHKEASETSEASSNELKTQLEAERAHVASLEALIARGDGQKTRADGLEVDLAVSEENVAKLEADLVAVRKTVVALEIEVAGYEETASIRAASLDTAQKRTFELEAQVETLLITASEHAVAVSNLAAATAAKEASDAALVAEKKSGQDRTAEFDATKIALSAALELTTELESKLAQAETQTATLESKLASCKTSSEASDKALATTRESLVAIQKTVSESESRVSKHSAEAEAALNELAVAKETVTRLQGDIIATRDAGNIALAAEKENGVRKVNELDSANAALADAKQTNATIDAELIKIKSVADALKFDLAASRTATAESTSELHEIRSELEAAKQAASKHKSAAIEYCAKTENLNTELRIARKASAKLQSEVAGAQSQAREEAEKLEVVRAAVEQERKTVEVLKKELTAMKEAARRAGEVTPKGRGSIHFGHNTDEEQKGEERWPVRRMERGAMDRTSGVDVSAYVTERPRIMVGAQASETMHHRVPGLQAVELQQIHAPISMEIDYVSSAEIITPSSKDASASDIGVLIGDPSSLTLCNLFMSDFQPPPHRDDPIPGLQNVRVSHVEHADDMQLIALGADGLQALLDYLYHWAAEKQLLVTSIKTWIMVVGKLPKTPSIFRLGGLPFKHTARHTHVGVHIKSTVGNIFALHYSDVATKARGTALASDTGWPLYLERKVEKFLGAKGDVEGARFNDEKSDDDDEDGDEDVLSDFSDEHFSSNSDSDSDAEEEVETDASRAARQAAMDKRQEAMDNLVPALPASEYGQMPAFYHSNSQRVARATVHTDTLGGAPSTSTSAPTSRPSTAPSGPPRQPRAPILMRDRYEGVDSDDETDSDSADDAGAESDAENQPQIVDDMGDVEVDMAEEEEEFLDFARGALGIGEEEWARIVRERRARGAFVPTSTSKKPTSSSTTTSTNASAKAHEPQLRAPKPGPRPNANLNLDSFEAVMQAMESELARSRAAKEPPKAPKSAAVAAKDKGKGKQNETLEDAAASLQASVADQLSATMKAGAASVKSHSASTPADQDEEMDLDIEAAMDRELRAALASSSNNPDDSAADDNDYDGVVDEDGLPLHMEGGLDYNLIKNFLESFKSQGGLTGPLSSLAGRLQPGWGLPRDDA
ncbi:unnamed protein product [Peniophora sp. CBMAI 1063]|nr:unnamed protein product [Peniophora sp. CBMAI 1063]